MPPLKPPLLLRRVPAPTGRKKKPCNCTLSTHSLLPPPPPSSAVIPLTTRRLLSLHGHGAAHFLQGLTTHNIPSSIPTPGFYSAFLNASGRVLHDVFIYPAAHSKAYKEDILGPQNDRDQGFLIDVDTNEVDSLAKHLKRFKLRAKVGVQVLDQEAWGVYQVWGSGAEQEHYAIHDIGCADNRAPDMGYRIIARAHKRPKSEEEGNVESYNLRRIMMGVAEGQSEILKETALPQESNIDYMGGIDFRKGCYVGQELTIRTHHTGVVRKRILPVQIYDPGKGSKPPDELSYDPNSKVILPPRGANVSRVDKKGRSAGKWLGGVGNVGLALCRLEVMTDTVLTGDGNQWGPEHEFKVAWDPEEGREGREVRIKAFVPSWHKSRAEGQRLQRI